MNLSLTLSIIAIVISIASAVFAGISATAARRSAKADEGTLAIEHERRLEERRPLVTAKLDGTGAHRTLHITLDSEESLSSIDVIIGESHFYGTPKLQGGWDCEFNSRVYGVIVPKPGEPALHAYSYNPYDGKRAGIMPHKSISWALNTKDRLKWVRLNVACHGAQGEQWDLTLTVKAEPEIEDTVA